MFISQKLRSCVSQAPTGPSIIYVGSSVGSYANASGLDTTGEALSLSYAETGDLVIFALAFDTLPQNTFAIEGMTFTTLFDFTNDENPGMYVGYGFRQAGDGNVYLSDKAPEDGDWGGLTAMVSVFRNVNSYLGSSGASGGTGLPDPPNLTATGGKLYVAIGGLDDDPIATNWTPPTSYSLAQQVARSGAEDTTLAMAYRINNLNSDNPSAFTGSGNDAWRAYTLAFD